ncbi:polysaccharide pyruvyl transferase family protein [Acinetobacter thermotolerans]|uniref:polysaccharide pyruvyl transferase family protein n=1 Tax=Acinetobacter thermotolerans TaxID=3151487 RepID=UPI00325B0982
MSDIKVIMRSLKHNLDLIVDYIEDRDDVIYLDYPLHYNVGDLLILLGGIQYLKEKNINVRKFLCVNNFKVSNLMKMVTPKTTILCHGGGNFGDIYTNHQKLRQDVVKNFPNNRIIILPQTAYFQDEKNQKESENLFSQHNNLIIFARDSVSLDIFKNHSPHSFLMPDMAHFLYENLPSYSNVSKTSLFFLRKDIEASASQENKKSNNSYDWDDLILESDEKQLKKIKRIMRLNKAINCTRIDDYVFKLWSEHIDIVINRSIAFFSEYDEVVTSRLHGHILACLLNKKSTVINNNYDANLNFLSH